jgi:hypothetical protein
MLLTLNGVLRIPGIDATIYEPTDGISVTQIKVENQEHAIAILKEIATDVPLQEYCFKLESAPKSTFVILDGKQILQ